MSNRPFTLAQAVLQYLMMTAGILGVWFCIEYFLTAYSLTSVPMAVLVLLMRIGTAVFVFLAIRKLRQTFYKEQYPWLLAWSHGIQLMFFAGLIEALVIYIYTNWLNPEYLLNLHTMQVDQICSSAALYRSYGLDDMAKNFYAMADTLKGAGPDSPIQAAFSMLSSDILMGMLLMIPMAFFLRKKKATNYPGQEI